VDYEDGHPYWIFELDSMMTIREWTWITSDTSNRTIDITQTMGENLRTIMSVDYTSTNGAGQLFIGYGDASLLISDSDGTDGTVVFVVLPGTNELIITKSGITGPATANVRLDHTHVFSGSVPGS